MGRHGTDCRHHPQQRTEVCQTRTVERNTEADHRQDHVLVVASKMEGVQATLTVSDQDVAPIWRERAKRKLIGCLVEWAETKSWQGFHNDRVAACFEDPGQRPIDHLRALRGERTHVDDDGGIW